METPDRVEYSIATVLSSDSPDSSLTNSLLSSKVGTGISLSASRLSLSNNGVASLSRRRTEVQWSASVHSVAHALGCVPLVAGVRPAVFGGVLGGALWFGIVARKAFLVLHKTRRISVDAAKDLDPRPIWPAFSQIFVGTSHFY